MIAYASTIVDIGTAHAECIGEQPALTWLDQGLAPSQSYCFAELDRAARALAVQLRELLVLPVDGMRLRGSQPLALILTRHGLEFAVAFLGCLYAGVVAVPGYPPRKGEAGERLKALIENCGAAFALVDRTTRDAVQASLGPGVRLIGVDGTDAGLASLWRRPPIDSESVAFVQYTSGSTGAPKGVVVTHGNLLANQHEISRAMRHDDSTRFVGWLPLFHDMGLVGNLLNPFYLGVHCVLMSPLAFIVNPIRWLEAISRYRATTSGGPNFGYELCLARTTPEQRASLDLSSWSVAFNGAEPVRAATLRRFSQAFAPHGFRESAFFPCYGMAETTLFVAGAAAENPATLLRVDCESLERGEVQPVEGEAGTRELVGCGAP